MIKLSYAVIFLFLFSTILHAQLKVTPFRPKAGAQQATIVEHKNFILYGSDTLNRIDASGQKKGAWIEYVKIYLHRSNGVSDVVDSTQSSYAIKMIGRYKNGVKHGLWYTFDIGGGVTDTIKYD